MKQLIILFLCLTALGFSQERSSVKGTGLITPIILTFDGTVQALNPAIPSSFAIGMEIDTGLPYPLDDIGFHVAPMIIVNEGVDGLLSPMVTFSPIPKLDRLRIGVGKWFWDSRVSGGVIKFNADNNKKTFFANIAFSMPL